MDDERRGANQHAGDQFAKLTAENASLRQRVAQLEANALAFTATEEALRSSEERFHRLFAQAHDAMYLVDPTLSQVIDVNRHGCTMLDISRDALLKPDAPDTAPEVGPFVSVFIEDIIACASRTMSAGRTMTAGGSPTTSAVTLTTRKGQRLQAEASTSLIRLEDRICVLALVRDVSEEKRAAREREEMLADLRRLTAVIEGTSDFVGMTDMTGEMIYVNPAGLRMVGRQGQAVRQLKMGDFLPEPEWTRVNNEIVPVILKNEEVWEGELHLRHADGHLIPTLQAILLVRDETGNPFAVAAIVRDITEMKRSEQRAQELSAIVRSEFLANMSHELRTPLNAILGFSQLLSHDPGLTAEQRDHVGVINRSGEKLLALINSILDTTKSDLDRLNEPSIDGKRQPLSAEQETPVTRAAGQGKGVLDPQQLRAQPAQLVAALHQATLEADFDRIFILIDRIGETDDALSAALASLANDFQYDQIMALTENAGHDA